jgi:hypothetical protein
LVATGWAAARAGAGASARRGAGAGAATSRWAAATARRAIRARTRIVEVKKEGGWGAVAAQEEVIGLEIGGRRQRP